MSRRSFVGGLGAAAVAAPAVISAGGRRGRRPNILFIQTDSWDGRALGAAGHPAMQRATPNLNALTQQGTLFENAYTNNPICCPCRASMFSGLYTHHCEGWNNYKGLEPGEPTFLDTLASAGYRVETIGKTDFLSGAHSTRARVSAWTRSANIERPQYNEAPPRIDQQCDSAHQNDWKLVDKTIAALSDAKRDDRPFFLYLGTGIPHPAFVTTPQYMAMVDQRAIDIPPADAELHPAMRYQQIVKNWRHGFTSDMVRTVRHVYYAMCAEADAMIGRVLAALDETGLTDSTYVVATSDHGENAMEHRQFYKMNMYESSARIPLIVAGPGVERGARRSRPVSLVDIYPTLMDMASIKTPAGLDGHSLEADLGGRGGVGNDWVLTEYHDSSLNTGTFMFRQGDWKYVAYAGQPPQLFNLKDDADEIRNVAAERPQVCQQLDAALAQVVDYHAVDAKVKAYDRESFARWRHEARAAGNYEEQMAVIFSGNDRLTAGEIRAWTAADEAKIAQWLG